MVDFIKGHSLQIQLVPRAGCLPRPAAFRVQTVLEQSWLTLRLPRAKEVGPYDGSSGLGDVHVVVVIRPYLSSLISPWENQGVHLPPKPLLVVYDVG